MRPAALVFLTLAIAEGAVASAEITHQGPLLSGHHWRLATDRGAIHVWRPQGWEGGSSAVVVYLHGYNTNVDQAWAQHRLPEQFNAAQKNALYVVPETPISLDDDVKWGSVGDILRAVADDLQYRAPGPLVVIGHSGAYRTLVPWLDYTPLSHLILLDSFYGNEEDYWDWLEGNKGHASHRLTLVGNDTARWCEPFMRRFPKEKDGFSVMAVPEKWEDLKPREQEARVLYMKSQYNHMAIVTDGKVIPVVLQRVPVKTLKPPEPVTPASPPPPAGNP